MSNLAAQRARTKAYVNHKSGNATFKRSLQAELPVGCFAHHEPSSLAHLLCMCVLTATARVGFMDAGNGKLLHRPCAVPSKHPGRIQVAQPIFDKPSDTANGRGNHQQRITLFSTNDYLGLASHPEVKAAIAECAAKHGNGPRASAIVAGHTTLHAELEARLTQLKGTEDALLFSTGAHNPQALHNATRMCHGTLRTCR